MIEYRRGVAKKRKNNHWHWHPECESFPQEAFTIRKDKPLDVDICPRCKAVSAS